MKTFYRTLAIVSAIALAACNKDIVPEPGKPDSPYTPVEYDIDDELEPSVWYASAVPDYMKQALGLRNVSIAANIDEAGIIVVASTELETFRESIVRAMKEGRMVFEMWPDNKCHYDFWTSIGYPAYLYPDNEDNDLLFLAIHHYSCFQLQNPFLLKDLVPTITGDTSEEEDEDNPQKTKSSDTGSESEVISDVKPVEIGETAEYLNTKISSFVDWANEHQEKHDVLTKADTPVVPVFDGDLSKRIMDSHYSQHVRKVLNVGVDNYEIAKVTWSDPDIISRNSQVECDVYITPLYAYELNGSDSGDYYLITMSVISHNGRLYGLYKAKHGLIPTYAHAFYSTNIQWRVGLCDTDNNYLGERVSFYETPQPATTIASTSYTHGFSKNFNVSGQGGYTAGHWGATITVGGSWTWNNSETTTLSDQTIIMETDENRRVNYHFETQNIKEEDETSKAIPAIARSDQKCEASWCWKVSGTKDDDTSERFHLYLSLYPEYGYEYYHIKWEQKTLFMHKWSKCTEYFDIMPPNRTRTGVLEFTSTTTADKYITNFKILDAKNTAVVDTKEASYKKDAVLRYQLPVGTYTITYAVLDGETGKPIVGSPFTIKNVEVTTGATVSKSHLSN